MNSQTGPMLANPSPAFISVPAAARHAGISVRSLRRLIETGKLPTYHPTAGRVVLDPVELDRYVRGTRAGGDYFSALPIKGERHGTD